MSGAALHKPGLARGAPTARRSQPRLPGGMVRGEDFVATDRGAGKAPRRDQGPRVMTSPTEVVT